MKKVFFFLVLLSISSYSCSSTKSIATHTAIPTATQIPIPISPALPTKSLVDTRKVVEILPDEYIDQLGDYPFLISPDGRKIALKFPTFDKNELGLLSVDILPLHSDEGKKIVEIQLDRASTYYYMNSWAPDSTGFVGGFFDADKLSGSEFCCGEAVAITNFINGEARTSIYSWDWNSANRILWSNDSSMLSITFFADEYKTLIIDRYGTLIRALEKGENAAFWSRNILYYTIQKEDKVELRSLDFDTQESKLVVNNFGKMYFVGENKKLSQVLLTETISKEDDTYSPINIFYILDLNTNIIQEIITPNVKIAQANSWASSPSQEFIALKVYVDWKEDRLWIFNWKTYEIKDYGQIRDLFGWYKNTNGFLVTSMDNEQKIIKP